MQFLESLPPDGPARDDFLLSCIASGMIDPPTWVLVRMGRVNLEVSSDYLAMLGEHVPMAAHVAQAAVDSLKAILPTPAIVDAIERAAVIVPMPTWSPPPGQDRSAQTSGAVFAWCEEETRRRFAAAGVLPGQLVAGHRKDVVIARHMLAAHVTIYGGRWPDGRRIQDVSAVHEAPYEDYSHGVRAVRRRCWLDGEETTVDAILSGPDAALLGGPVAALRYPLDASPTIPAPPPGPRLLRRGDRGEDVREVQRLLTEAGWFTTADSIFGPMTEAAVRMFQSETRGLTQDGIVGAKTLAALRTAGDTSPGDTLPDVPPVLSEAEVDALFGPLRWEPAPRADEPGAVRIVNGWQRDNLRRVVIPQLRGIVGAPVDGGIYLHRLLVEQTRALWAAWEAAGLLPLVRSWAGSWNPRLVRGRATLSRHAYAISWDVNAAWNALGKAPAPRGAPGSVVELVPLAVAHGYSWGGAWARPDGMHFEGVRVL